MSRLRSNPSRGFSLIESMVVLIVVATVAMIAAPRYAAATTRYQVERVAHQLAADLQLARSIARSEGRTVRVRFDPAADKYRILEADPHDPGEDYVVTLDEPPFNAELVSAGFDGSKDVDFTPFGTAVRHSDQQPFASGVVIVSVAGEQRTVTVEAGNGRVTMP